MRNTYLFFTKRCILRMGMILVCSILMQIASGQVYMIQSKEGYTNIRSAANAQSTVKAKLKNNTVVLLDEATEDPIHGNWIKILYYVNRPFTYLKPEKDMNLQSGFLHKSQLVNIEDLPSPEAGEFTMTYTVAPFHKADYKLSYIDGSTTAVETVNGNVYYAADCGLPKTAVKSATAIINGHKIIIPEQYLFGILHAENALTIKKYNKVYIAYQTIGDGACGNHLVWVFEGKNLVQRFIGWAY